MTTTTNSPPSFEKVNYLFRPRKQIERKIIIEILQELKGQFNNFQDHEYIGMGSIYYYDFILFHKLLDFEKMTSIDDKVTTKRFLFNKPYEFISFKNQLSTDFLSSQKWTDNRIIWMDYDLKLNEVILDDFGILSKNCIDRDILIFTIDAQCDYDDDKKDEFINTFEDFIPSSFQKDEYFEPLYFPKLLETICLNIFKDQMLYDNYKFNKLFSFTYSDRAKMYTLGGIFSDPEKIPKLTNLFLRQNHEIIDIDIPLITYKEKYYLVQRS